MPNNVLRIEGLDQLQADLDQLAYELDPARGLRDTMNLATGMAHRYATGIVHVKTGRLKNSLFVPPLERRGNRLIGRVATNVEYAPAEEARGGSHAFFARTIREEGPNINNLFRLRIAGR